jgi:hypothetical protein
MKKTLLLIPAMILSTYVANAGDTNDIAFSTTVTSICADGRKVIRCDILKSELNKTKSWNPKNAESFPFDINEYLIQADKQLENFAEDKTSYFKLTSITLQRYKKTDKWLWRYTYKNKYNLLDTYSVMGYLNGKVQAPKDSKDGIIISTKSTIENELSQKPKGFSICDDYLWHTLSLEAAKKTNKWAIEEELVLPLNTAIKIAEIDLSEFLPETDNRKKILSSISLQRFNFNSEYWFYVFRYSIDKEKGRNTACIPVLFNGTVAKRKRDSP